MHCACCSNYRAADIQGQRLPPFPIGEPRRRNFLLRHINTARVVNFFHIAAAYRTKFYVVHHARDGHLGSLANANLSLFACLPCQMSGNRRCLLHDAFTKVQSLLFQQVNVRHDTSNHQHLYTVERELLNVRQSTSQELRGIYRGDTFFQGCRGIRDDVVASDAVPSLLPVQRWHSAKASPAESVTLVTQLTIDRLPMLQAQCSAWKEPLAASVYVPFVPNFGVLSYEIAALNGSAIHDVIDLLNDFVAFTKTCADCCALELELVVETHATMESPFAKLYPVNAMRNRALLLADTDVILLLDVDFVPSASLSYSGKSIEYEILVSQLESGAVMVVPAFEVLQLGSLGVARQFALQVVAESDKMQIADAMEAGQLSGFHLRNWYVCLEKLSRRNELRGYVHFYLSGGVKRLHLVRALGYYITTFFEVFV
jgi:hypothetical protein